MGRTDIQTIDDVKTKVDTLSLEEKQKKEILELLDEFEKRKNDRDGKPLRNIMVKIGTINILAGAFLFDYSENSGLLSKMIS